MKKKKSKIIKALSLVNEIQNIRSANNRNWMDLLKLSLTLDFKATSRILKEICKEDAKISKIAKQIHELK